MRKIPAPQSKVFSILCSQSNITHEPYLGSPEQHPRTNTKSFHVAKADIKLSWNPQLAYQSTTSSGFYKEWLNPAFLPTSTAHGPSGHMSLEELFPSWNQRQTVTGWVVGRGTKKNEEGNQCCPRRPTIVPPLLPISTHFITQQTYKEGMVNPILWKREQRFREVKLAEITKLVCIRGRIWTQELLDPKSFRRTLLSLCKCPQYIQDCGRAYRVQKKHELALLPSRHLKSSSWDVRPGHHTR